MQNPWVIKMNLKMEPEQDVWKKWWNYLALSHGHCPSSSTFNEALPQDDLHVHLIIVYLFIFPEKGLSLIFQVCI